MRILIANRYRNLIGGVERYLQVVIPGLLNRGHDLALLYEDRCNPDAETIDAANARLPAWCASEKSGQDLLEAIRQWGPDLVYSQGLEDGELEQTLLNAYPMVLFAHNYLGTCISGRKCHSLPTPRPCGRRFGGACLVLYYPRRCGGLNPLTMIRMYRQQSQVHARLSRVPVVLVASLQMLQEFENNWARPDQVKVVPLPAAGNFSGSSDPAPRIPEGRVLFMGRVTDIKGAGYLVRALAKAGAQLGRALTLTIAGDGPQLPDVLHLAQTLGVAVTSAGWVRSAEKLELLRQADLLGVPSLWPEPFGLVGVEAGCQGVPAAGYSTGGILDWLEPGVSGEVAPADPPTVAGLAGAIVRALSDTGHYQRLRAGAREMARKFTLDRHLERLEPILVSQADRVSSQPIQPAVYD